jgi:hypothetical protein
MPWNVKEHTNTGPRGHECCMPEMLQERTNIGKTGVMREALMLSLFAMPGFPFSWASKRCCCTLSTTSFRLRDAWNAAYALESKPSRLKQPHIQKINLNYCKWYHQTVTNHPSPPDGQDKTMDYRSKGTGFNSHLNHKRRSTCVTMSYYVWEN